MKIGVGAKPHPDYDLADWVLSTFSQQEEKTMAPVWDWAGEAALAVVTLGVEQAASQFNGLGK
ncbi:peptidyl-tRNA hydrolase [Firmicutes bacterium CAG:137]|nr:peptidyl-tRNA hydrolase [Firmicutes bacterium CAG:137]